MQAIGNMSEEQGTSSPPLEEVERENGNAQGRKSPSTERGGVLGLSTGDSANPDSRRGICRTIPIIVGIHLFSSMAMSLQSPLYPIEAEQKGATALEYGFVFGIFEFIIFLACPIFGKFMNRIGHKRVLTVSVLLSSTAVICFGLLDWVENRTWFITLCFICRIVEALGAAGFITVSFVIIVLEYPNSVAKTYAYFETVIGLGCFLGPIVGALLFERGGFPLPFLTFGACLLVTGIIAICRIPTYDTITEGYGVDKIFQIPTVALAAFSIASTALSMGYVSATLEPHIRRFGLTSFLTGVVFTLNGVIYAISSLICGYLCDKIEKPIYITIVGNILIFISSVIIGPATFIPLETTLWVTIVGAGIQGVGMGCCFVSAMFVMLSDSKKKGIPDDVALYAVVSGLCQSMTSLGAFVGPSLGGYLYDTVGFRYGSLPMVAFSFIMAGTVPAYLFYAGWSGTASTAATSSPVVSEERQPLLRPPVAEKKNSVEQNNYNTLTSEEQVNGSTSFKPLVNVITI